MHCCCHSYCCVCYCCCLLLIKTLPTYRSTLLEKPRRRLCMDKWIEIRTLWDFVCRRSCNTQKSSAAMLSRDAEVSRTQSVIEIARTTGTIDYVYAGTIQLQIRIMSMLSYKHRRCAFREMPTNRLCWLLKSLVTCSSKRDLLASRICLPLG